MYEKEIQRILTASQNNAFPDLPFDAFFPLIIGRIVGVNDGFHVFLT